MGGFFWALVFFGLLGAWTARLRPPTLAALAVLWAMLTSATEWFVLVPLFPFWQPIFTLQQPYWIGFFVHLSSALIYPLFAWLRWPLGDAPATRTVYVAKNWALAATCVLLLSGVSAFAGTRGLTIPHMSSDAASDQRYMRHMQAHHEQGIELASSALDASGSCPLHRDRNINMARHRDKDSNRA